MKTNKKLKTSIVCKNVVKYFVTVALLILFRQKGKKKKKKKKNKQTKRNKNSTIWSLKCEWIY